MTVDSKFLEIIWNKDFGILLDRQIHWWMKPHVRDSLIYETFSQPKQALWLTLSMRYTKSDEY